jgi:hypothetical protein
MNNIILIVFLLYNLLLLPLSYYCYKYVKYLDRCITNISNGNCVNVSSVNESSVNGSSVNGNCVNGSGVNGNCVNGSGVNGNCVNGSGVNGNVISNDYKELINLYIQVIRTCKSIYEKCINMQ